MHLDRSIMEIDGLAVNMSHVDGVKPSTLGSSGIIARNWSSCSLNESTGTLDMFLIDDGRQVKSLGPLTWKDCSL